MLPKEVMRNRINKITGVYFCRHARNRGHLSNSEMKQFQDKIKDLRGRFYWDEKHGNYQFTDGDIALPFSLQLNQEKPGLFALVKTAINYGDRSRYQCSRFQQLID